MVSTNIEIRLMGVTLREFRTERNFSQEKLAEKAALHRTYIGSVERGERNPSFLSLSRILRSMDVSWIQFGQALEAKIISKTNNI